jgi:hypothetical protein
MRSCARRRGGAARPERENSYDPSMELREPSQRSATDKREKARKDRWQDMGTERYLKLGLALCEEIAVAQVIDVYVLDELDGKGW